MRVSSWCQARDGDADEFWAVVIRVDEVVALRCIQVIGDQDRSIAGEFKMRVRIVNEQCARSGLVWLSSFRSGVHDVFGAPWALRRAGKIKHYVLPCAEWNAGIHSGQDEGIPVCRMNLVDVVLVADAVRRTNDPC